MPWVETRFNCKMEGCPNPCHRYPNGTKAAYCKTHLRFRKGKHRGDVHVTGPMSVVLLHLRDQKKAGAPFAALPKGTDKRTVTALEERDWIYAGDFTAPVYAITLRGEKALKACEGIINRRDGLCPKCGERPRPITSGGKLAAYCHVCESQRAKEKAARGAAKIDPSRGCSRCGNHPLHRYSTGRYSTYCTACEQARSRAKSQRSTARRRALAQSGGYIKLCPRCNQKPVVVTANAIASYCVDCRRLLHRRWKLRRVLDSLGYK